MISKTKCHNYLGEVSETASVFAIAASPTPASHAPVAVSFRVSAKVDVWEENAGGFRGIALRTAS